MVKVSKFWLGLHLLYFKELIFSNLGGNTEREKQSNKKIKERKGNKITIKIKDLK